MWIFWPSSAKDDQSDKQLSFRPFSRRSSKWLSIGAPLCKLVQASYIGDVEPLPRVFSFVGSFLRRLGAFAAFRRRFWGVFRLLMQFRCRKPQILLDSIPYIIIGHDTKNRGISSWDGEVMDHRPQFCPISNSFRPFTDCRSLCGPLGEATWSLLQNLTF